MEHTHGMEHSEENIKKMERLFKVFNDVADKLGGQDLSKDKVTDAFISEVLEGYRKEFELTDKEYHTFVDKILDSLNDIRNV